MFWLNLYILLRVGYLDSWWSVNWSLSIRHQQKPPSDYFLYQSFYFSLFLAQSSALSDRSSPCSLDSKNKNRSVLKYCVNIKIESMQIFISHIRSTWNYICHEYGLFRFLLNETLKTNKLSVHFALFEILVGILNV